jgi:hypothetical protein
MKKKIIVLNVNKSVAEIDWILPLIYQLKNEFKIFTLFQHREAYNTLVKDKLLFNLWREVSHGYNVETIFEKTWRFLDVQIFYKLFSNKILNPFFRYNIKNYFKKNKINFSEIAIFFTEFGTYSPHINYIKNEKERPKIIHFPTSAFIFPKTTLNKIANYSLRGDNLIVCNDLDVNFWSKRIERNKIRVVGAPKYDSSWLNKITNDKKIIENKKPIILIAYSSRFQHEVQKNEKQLNDIMQVLEHFKEYKIIFKIHPRKKNPYYLKILKNYKNLDIEISNENLINLSRACNIFLHDRDSSVIYDGLVFKKPTIEYWDTGLYNEIEIAPDFLKLNVRANNAEELKKLIKLAIDEPGNKIWDNQKKAFNVNCKKFGENATQHCVNALHKLLEENKI